MFFKSDAAKAAPGADFAMRDVLRATTAAPTFFTPDDIPTADPAKSYALVDGGMVATIPDDATGGRTRA